MSSRLSLKAFLRLFFLAIAVSLLSPTVSAPSCVTPVDDLEISSSTTLCPGSYLLTDTKGDGILKIVANAVTLDCDLARISGTGLGIGINVTGFRNFQVRNCIITNYTYGVLANTSGRIIVANNQFFNMSEAAVLLRTSSSVSVIQGNLFQSNYRDVFVDDSDISIIRNNNFSDARFSNVVFQMSSGHLVANNTFGSADYGILFAVGANRSSVTNNTFTGMNTASVFFTVSGSLSAFNNSVWMNRFYGRGVLSGIRQQTFCLGSRGNYYNISIPLSSRGWNDCGHPKLVGPFPTPPRPLAEGFEDRFRVNWTNQSSYPTNMSFYIELDNGSRVWMPVNFTPGNSTLFDTDSYANLCSYRLRIFPWDGVTNGTINETARFCIKTRGRIQGTVSNCNGSRGLWDASIWLFNSSPWGLHRVVETDGAGRYDFRNVRYNNYTVVVNYTGYTNARRNLTLRAFTTETRNFNAGEVCPLTSDCEADCTRLGQGTCDASCNGVNGCSFQPACIGSRGGLRVFFNETHDAACCTTTRYVQKTGGLSVSIPGQNVVKMTSIVNFRDAFKYIVGAKMNVVVFRKRQ